MSSKDDQNATLQLSLGATANAVTAHLINLQGLAIASKDGETGPLCNPTHTHYASSSSLWLPRVLFVDEPSQFLVPAEQQGAFLSSIAPDTNPFATTVLDTDWQVPHAIASPVWSQLRQTAWQLAPSRYDAGSTQSNVYAASSQNPRHVDWDAIEEEEEEDYGDSLLQQRGPSSSIIPSLQEQLAVQSEVAMKEVLPNNNDNEGTDPNTTESTPHWMDYLMPPYSQQHSCVALPMSLSSSSLYTEAAQSYSIQGDMKSWTRDILWDESIRNWLEATDVCRSIQLHSTAQNMYAGLSTWLLQEFQQECSSAGRLVYEYHSKGERDKPKENHKLDPNTLAPSR